MYRYNRYGIINKFKRYIPDFFWGSPFDVRFYLAYRVAQIRRGRLLDIGCGPGILLSQIDANVFAVGIDYSESMLRIAKKINDAISYVRCDMYNLPLRDGSFDYVIVANSFGEFDWEVDKAIHSGEKHLILVKEIARVLRHKGTLFLTTPNRKHRYYKDKHKADTRILTEALRTSFNFKIYGFNPFPILFPAFLDVKPLSMLYLALLETLMGISFLIDISMSFFVKATKKSQTSA